MNNIPHKSWLDSFRYIYLDMDGTIAGLYKVKNWLNRIRAEQSGVYLEAKPLITEKELFEHFPNNTAGKDRIWVVTMAPPDCSLDYKTQVFQEKNEWLAKYFPNLNNRVFLNNQDHKNICYSLKHDYSKVLLIDDSPKLRDSFIGQSIHPWWAEVNPYA